MTTDDLRTRAKKAAEEECDIHPGPGMRRVLAAVTRAAFESIDVDELARALQQRAAYEGVVILDHPAQLIARDLRTDLTGDESNE